MPLIESFTIDHTTMKAPQVRKAKVMNGAKGDVVEVFDLRFIKPNTEPYMSIEGMHTMEHTLATYIREKLEGIIDLSPMGCRTGFYMSMFGEHTIEEIETALIYGLEKVIATEEIPGATEKECGNYKSHSLKDAKEIAKRVIKGFKDGAKV
jgi:S-ribosylhomocysteine lyase